MEGVYMLLTAIWNKHSCVFNRTRVYPVH